MQAPYTLWCDRLPRPGWRNMAIDATLLERAQAGERWLRLYAWEPTLSFGRHEPAARRYDRAAIESSAIAVVRRPTGGRAVWHAGELTYAVATPAEALGALRAAYRDIHLLLRDAVRRLGAPAELAPDGRGAPLAGGACFAGTAGGEVVIAGRKLVGSAQLRRDGTLLQHGSILIEDDQGLVARITRGPAPPDRSCPLREALGRPVTWNEVAAAVADSATATWGPFETPTAGALSEVLSRAEDRGERFRSAAWTWAGTWTADATRPPC